MIDRTNGFHGAQQGVRKSRLRPSDKNFAFPRRSVCRDSGFPPSLGAAPPFCTAVIDWDDRFELLCVPSYVCARAPKKNDCSLNGHHYPAPPSQNPHPRLPRKRVWPSRSL